MPELTPEMLGNLKMVGGGLLVAYLFFKDQINAKVGSYFSTQKTSGFNPEEFELLKHFSVHDVVEVLLEDRTAEGDEEGALLIATFGKHIYDFSMETKEDKEDEGN